MMSSKGKRNMSLKEEQSHCCSDSARQLVATEKTTCLQTEGLRGSQTLFHCLIAKEKCNFNSFTMSLVLFRLVHPSHERSLQEMKHPSSASIFIYILFSSLYRTLVVLLVALRGQHMSRLRSNPMTELRQLRLCRANLSLHGASNASRHLPHRDPSSLI